MIIAVYDGVQKDRETAAQLISEFCKTRGIMAEIAQFSKADEIIGVFRQYSFTAVFIGLNSMQGVDTAWIVRKRDKKCPLVIMSHCSDYSLEGFRLEALEYLIKPLDDEKIFRVLDRLIKLQGEWS